MRPQWHICASRSASTRLSSHDKDPSGVSIAREVCLVTKLEGVIGWQSLLRKKCIPSRCLIGIIYCKFAQRKKLIPITLSVIHEIPQTVFHNSVNTFRHSIGSGLIGVAYFQLPTKNVQFKGLKCLLSRLAPR